MGLSPRQLNRTTLARQLLLQRERLPVVDAVGHVVALQAQEPPSPYIALWNRVAGFDPADLDAAFATHEVVKASLMRVTLHAVTAEDYPSFHEAMQPPLRGSRLYDTRFTSTGLTIADADALVPHVVGHATEPRTKQDVETLLAEHLGEPPQRGVWWALRTFAPLVHAPTGDPWSFGRQAAYIAAPNDGVREDHEQAVRRLIRRYLEGFGPATARDFAQFTILRQATYGSAVEAMADELVRVEGPDGALLLDVPGAPILDEDTPAPPRLLPMWDSVLLAYSDRNRVIPEDYRRVVIRRNGDVLPTMLVDGYVAGVWRPVDGTIEGLAFHPLPKAVWDGLAAEAESLLEMLAERDSAVYRRYARWWSDLTADETRTLAG